MAAEAGWKPQKGALEKSNDCVGINPNDRRGLYLDKPVLVSGRFYVGGTTHNNLAHGRNTNGESYSYGQPEHMLTVYPNFRCNESYVLPCNPPVALERYSINAW